MISAEAHALILRKVALRAVIDARAAWKKARDSPTEKRVRLAFRSCVFAERALRKAADVLPGEAIELRAEARRIGAETDKLHKQLAHIAEGVA